MKEQLLKTYRECFPEDSKEYANYYINSKYTGDNVYTFLENKKVVSMCFVLENTLNVGGKVINCPFFSAVCTKPEERKKGFGRKLLLEAMRDLRNKGVVAVSLYPEKSSFYAPLGFITYAFSNKYLVKDPFDEYVEELTEDNAQEILDLYNEYSNNFYVREDFTLNQMKKRIEEYNLEGKVVGARKNGKLMAYAMYDNEKEVDQVAYIDPFYLSRLGIQSFRTPTLVGREESMIRVINIVEFLKNVNYTNEFNIHMKIKITDEVLPENNCIVDFEVKDGVSVVKKLSKDSQYDIDYLAPDLVSTILRCGKNLAVKKY